MRNLFNVPSVRAAWTVAALAFIVAAPAGAAIVFSDATFNDLDWSSTVVATTGGATAPTASQQATGGNPGAFRRMTHNLPANSSVNVFHEYLPTAYTPSVSGPISGINYSEDQIEFNPPFAGAKIASAAALIQGGIVYKVPSTSWGNTTWVTAPLANLTALDFTAFGGTAHPDFSSAGAPIHFGYFRANSQGGGSTIVTDHGIDNWSVTITPEPSGALLLAIGLAAVSARRRRRPADPR